MQKQYFNKIWKNYIFHNYAKTIFRRLAKSLFLINNYVKEMFMYPDNRPLNIKNKI